MGPGLAHMPTQGGMDNRLDIASATSDISRIVRARGAYGAFHTVYRTVAKPLEAELVRGCAPRATNTLMHIRYQGWR
jgi:hypothetical protein